MTTPDRFPSPSPAIRTRCLRTALAALGATLTIATGAACANEASSTGVGRAPRADQHASQRVEQLLADGEAAYQDRKDQEAFAAFGQVAAIAPADARAWLRIGNLWQRNGEAWRAIEAYRRAVAGPREEPAMADASAARAEALMQARSKAAFNLAAIGIEQARVAMQAVDRARLPATMQPAAEAMERRLRAAERAADTAEHEPARPALR